MINMLLVQVSNHPYKFDRNMLIRDPVWNPQIGSSSVLKTLGPDIQKGVQYWDWLGWLVGWFVGLGLRTVFIKTMPNCNG